MAPVQSDLIHICVHLLFVSFIRMLVVGDFLHAFILMAVFKIFALSIRFLCARKFDIIMTTFFCSLHYFRWTCQIIEHTFICKNLGVPIATDQTQGLYHLQDIFRIRDQFSIPNTFCPPR